MGWLKKSTIINDNGASPKWLLQWGLLCKFLHGTWFASRYQLNSETLLNEKEKREDLNQFDTFSCYVNVLKPKY